MNYRKQNDKLSHFAVAALLVSAGAFSSVALFGSDSKDEAPKKKISTRVIKMRDGKVEEFSSDKELSEEERKKIDEEVDNAMKELDVNIDVSVFDDEDGDSTTHKPKRIMIRGLRNVDSVMKISEKALLHVRTMCDSLKGFNYNFELKDLKDLKVLRDSMKVFIPRMPNLPDLPDMKNFAPLPPDFRKNFNGKNFSFRSFSDSLGNKKHRRIIIIETDDEDADNEITKGDQPVIEKEETVLNGKLDEMPPIQELDIFPNPTSGKIVLNFTAPEIKDGSITVTNLEGKEVYREDLNNFSGEYSKTIDISGNGKGTYILNITGNGKTLSEKIILE